MLRPVLRVNPYDLGIGAKPGELALGQPARVALGELHRLRERHLAAHGGGDLPIADRSQAADRSGSHPACQQPAHLVDEAARDHLVKAPVDCLVEPFALHREPDRQSLVLARGKAMALLMRAYRLAGQSKYFERAHDAIKIAMADARGREGVDFSPGARADTRPRVRRRAPPARGVLRATRPARRKFRRAARADKSRCRRRPSRCRPRAAISAIAARASLSELRHVERLRRGSRTSNR